jgi:hypothetical protein
MGTHMKTTIDIADSILSQARKLAAREGTTLKVLVETGLRRVIAEKKKAGEFRLRDAAFEGRGLQPGVRGLDWEQIRELAYEGRGE